MSILSPNSLSPNSIPKVPKFYTAYLRLTHLKGIVIFLSETKKGLANNEVSQMSVRKHL